MVGFRTLLPTFILAGELIIIAGFFLPIRFSFSSGGTVLFITLAVGLSSALTFKKSLEGASYLTKASREFSRAPYPSTKYPVRFSKEDRIYLASCRPLVIKVAGSFAITKETFPTVSRDIILGNVINLLLMFK